MSGFKNVTIGGVHMSDMGLALANKEIGLPDIQTKQIQIPFRDGALDLTNVLSGRPHYGNRALTLNMNCIDPDKLQKMSSVANALHGQKARIIFDEDPEWFYYGRLDLSSFKENRLGGEYVILADCDPFKYSVTSSDEEWLWDPFSFIDGVIMEFSNIQNIGTNTYLLIANEMPTLAKITTDAQITVTYEGVAVIVYPGTTTLYEFQFAPGENEITISGNATVSIDYRGGRL